MSLSRTSLGVLLAVITVNVFLFQNCSQKSFDALDSSSSSIDETSKTESQLEEAAIEEAKAASCPVYQQPICKEGWAITVVEGSNGCERPTCVISEVNKCPAYMIPQCKANEIVVEKKTAEGCSYGACQPKACSVDMVVPKCAKGEVAVSQVGVDGCTVWKCSSKKTCPASIPKECAKGEIHKIITPAGCESYICVKNPNPSCPQFMAPRCKANQKLKYIMDSRGCSVPSCITLK